MPTPKSLPKTVKLSSLTRGARFYLPFSEREGILLSEVSSSSATVKLFPAKSEVDEEGVPTTKPFYTAIAANIDVHFLEQLEGYDVVDDDDDEDDETPVRRPSPRALD